MTRKQKLQVIERLTVQLNDNNVIYVADISGLDAKLTSDLRRNCFKDSIKLEMVKNTLLAKAMNHSDKEFGELSSILKGSSSILISQTANAPAKLIKEFRKKSEKPLLKGAYLEEVVYIGDEQLDALVSIKSREELVADVIALLQSPVKNVLSALKSGNQKLSGIVKALSER